MEGLPNQFLPIQSDFINVVLLWSRQRDQKEKYDRPRTCFLWSGEKEKQKYHLVAWSTVCRPKDLGGLGVSDLELMNIALLAKWLWKLFNVDGL